MKKIFKGTIIFAVCLTLAACGTGSPREITVQSITEPMITMQTVGKVPEVTTVTENTDHWTEPAATEEPDEWEIPVETDDTDNTNDPAFDPPMQEIPVYTVETVTLPDAIDSCMHNARVEYMFHNELPVYAPDDYEAWESDYDECNLYYKKLLAERLINHCDRVELFGGAYFRGGRLQVKITDYDSRDEVFGDIFDGLKGVNISSCTYSYAYLIEVQGIIQQAQTGTSAVDIEKNCVKAVVPTEFAAEFVRNAVENAGLDLEAVHIEVGDYVIANPC